MKQKIRCYFTDFWEGSDYKYHLGFLLDEYDIIIDREHPDYLFFSCFGNNHLFYTDCIKIFWCGENIIPDLNLCDYAVCLSDIQAGDRIYHHYLTLYKKGRNAVKFNLTPDELLNRKFCNFVYSNNDNAFPYRERIFKELSKYKRIDSGGAFLNNMGERVKDKLSFQREYKFSLAIENSSIRGYTTEKIYEPFLAQSLPVYWGNPNISSDYHPNSFVNLMQFSSVEEAVEEIIRLDKDDTAYLEKVMTPFWPYGNSFEEFYEIEMEKEKAFFRHIFDQPIDEAYRHTEYGCNRGYIALKKSMVSYYNSPVCKGYRKVERKLTTLNRRIK
ncbi:glycosyltransferase family 10 domain-containing protein [Parabacteroides timonensis]|uniref:glycosyltransferase family 10 domain-containing protein n=1 Tax=Parabacteroides timonensis TaxID=1871013 RepID=UPI00094E357A|nr:glycosyltransferase family 10 [Parabacteroides timonensis]